MALDIVISVAGKIAESLVDPVWHQFQYLFSYHETIENLEKRIDDLDVTSSRVQHSVEEAERNAETIEKDVLKWQKEVEELKEAVNQVIEGTKNAQMACLHCSYPNIRFRYSLSRKATKLSSEVQKLIEKGKFDRVGYLRRQTTPVLLQDFEKFETRSLTLNEVLETLKDSKVSIIGICGMAGVGKTKMVNEIAERVKVDKSFDEVAITVVSQSLDSFKIQGELADQLGLKDFERDSIRERAKRLRQRLDNNKRILVIFDDLWADLDLASLGIPIRDGRKGLKVILTSRSRYVCIRMDAQRIIEVEVLNWTEAWLLFKEISRISDDDDEDDLKHIAEEVAKECGGLPLAIVIIGGLLKNNKRKHAWNVVLRQLKMSSVTTIAGQENLVFSRIELSYESLKDNDYKSLLLLCGLFPEDADIPIESLVRYVKGLQVFKEVEKFNAIRDKVDTIIDHLKACFLVLSSKKQWHVKLHDVVRDVCLSIASRGEHVYLSRHGELIEWPQDISSLEHFTAISVTFSKMNQLPTNLQCPWLGLLSLSGSRADLPNIPMEGMKHLRVLELNSLSVQSPLSLQFLTSLRTLCLEYCIFKTETSIGCLKQLEVLSFYKSSVLHFPKEVSQMTNLKLLDLRFGTYYRHPYPSGVFSHLNKLEELYMGDYSSENEEEAKQEWNTEVNLLPYLTTFQMNARVIDIMLQILRGLNLVKMERFNIAYKDFVPYEDEFQRRLFLYEMDTRALAENSIRMLATKTEALTLGGIRGLKNLVPELNKDGFNNLKDLVLLNNSDLEYVIDSTNVKPQNVLKNLESLYLYGGNLKGFCYGSIQPPSLCNLKSIKVKYCNPMKSLFSQSISKCLMHLQHLEIDDCWELEKVISMEEITDDKVVKFSHLKTLHLGFLKKLKGFYFGNTSQALLNQVWLPALVDLKIYDNDCFQRIVGCDMSNGSLHKLKSMYVNSCEGVECITKADSVTLLQHLTQLIVCGCDKLQVKFDLEGITSTEDRLVLLPQLDSLWLSHLLKATSIWRMVPKGIQAFQNLSVLNVDSCYRIKHLLSPPLAKMLVNLEELDIRYCESMEEIIGKEEERGKQVTADIFDDNITKFVFPKLRYISLKYLKELRSFSSGDDHELIFPSLAKLRITECPQLQNFACGKLSAPRLEQVNVRKQDVVPIDLKNFKVYKDKEIPTRDDESN